MDIIVFEDELYKNFLPLTWTRPVWDLRCGATTLLERIKRKFPGNEIFFKGRDYLVKNFSASHKCLELNGRILASTGREVKYIWDLVVNLRQDLEEDLNHMGRKVNGWVHPTAVIYNDKNVFIEEGAEVEAFSVLDARSGPIYIGKKSIIRPHSYLKGPLSIGPNCRIGGEVVHSIFHANSNKSHYGFIGHSYIGEWVNLGAGTTNSNLKNNYSNVKVALGDGPIDTNEQFFGCVIADHAKLGIGTLIPTGAVIGPCANIFGGGLIPKFVPAFSWGIMEEFKFDKAIDMIRQVMRRRMNSLSEEEQAILEKVFSLTAAERKT